jgi:hypothetical protein
MVPNFTPLNFFAMKYAQLEQRTSVDMRGSIAGLFSAGGLWLLRRTLNALIPHQREAAAGEYDEPKREQD